LRGIGLRHYTGSSISGFFSKTKILPLITLIRLIHTDEESMVQKARRGGVATWQARPAQVVLLEKKRGRPKAAPEDASEKH
jgi:hypothetical protein